MGATLWQNWSGPMAESDSARRLRVWTEAQNKLAPGETALDRLLSDMTCPSWWHRVRDEDGIVAAILPKVPSYASGSPEQRALEDEWEARSIKMHSQQTTITIPDKPLERSRIRSGSAVAAFEAQYADEPVPNFADTPGATGKHTTTKRGN